MIVILCEIKNSIFNWIYCDKFSFIYIFERYKCWWYKNDNMRDVILILVYFIFKWIIFYDFFDVLLIGKLF